MFLIFKTSSEVILHIHISSSQLLNNKVLFLPLLFYLTSILLCSAEYPSENPHPFFSMCCLSSCFGEFPSILHEISTFFFFLVPKSIIFSPKMIILKIKFPGASVG